MKGVSTLSNCCQCAVSVSMMAVVSMLLTPPTSAQVSMKTLVSDHLKERDEILRIEKSRGLGASLKLSKNEEIVNNFMLKEKKKLMEDCRKKKIHYWPSDSFFVSKPLMEEHILFKIIKKMPKGGLLHAHFTAVTSLEWIIRNITHRPGVWFCQAGDKLVSLGYFKTDPTPEEGCTWKKAADARRENGTETFDEWLKKSISYLSTDPLKTYPTVTDIWKRFEMYFGQMNVLKPQSIQQDYYRQMMKEAMEDGVQYLEPRTSMYYLKADGEKSSNEEFLDTYRDMTKKFISENPEFIGTKFILNGKRYQSKERTKEYVEAAVRLRKSHPDMMKGFDLVAQEDTLNSLKFYLEELLYPASVGSPSDVPYFFHAGETNWQGTEVDENLVDAVVFPSTKRIGHAFALVKHPYLMELVKKKDIGIECNPISNQVLGYVKDVRNHAVIPLMADNFGVVVTSDDPTVWEAAPLSHDFFVAFMNMAGEHTGLRFLKQLAINSIKYSAMEHDEKIEAYCKWEKWWVEFISATIQFINGKEYQLAKKANFKCKAPNLTPGSTSGPASGA